ncbi:MAG: hypothetical protein JW719_12750 [Pirellulales bacterium]|nr:hypothetical protein [Pirellulales bacterium]
MLDRAIGLLERYHSVAANVTCEADLFGKRVAAKGDYREQRSGPLPKVRLELKMPIGDKTGALVEACDGRYLWSYLRLADEEELTQVDLQRVVQELGSADAGSPTMSLSGTIGMGGLAGLIRELKRNFQFDVIEPVPFRGEPAWELRGGWRPARLAAILPDQKDAILRGEAPRWEKMPGHLPSRVILTLGRDNLLPYRLDYRRQGRAAEGGATLDASAGVEGSVVVEWFNLSVNEPMKPSEFEFSPGDVDVNNVTDTFIERLKTRAGSDKTD